MLRFLTAPQSLAADGKPFVNCVDISLRKGITPCIGAPFIISSRTRLQVGGNGQNGYLPNAIQIVISALPVPRSFTVNVT